MKLFRSKPVGWRGDSYRHYLARKGVATRKYLVRQGEDFLVREETDTDEDWDRARMGPTEGRVAGHSKEDLLRERWVANHLKNEKRVKEIDSELADFDFRVERYKKFLRKNK